MLSPSRLFAHCLLRARGPRRWWLNKWPLALTLKRGELTSWPCDCLGEAVWLRRLAVSSIGSPARPRPWGSKFRPFFLRAPQRNRFPTPGVSFTSSRARLGTASIASTWPQRRPRSAPRWPISTPLHPTMRRAIPGVVWRWRHGSTRSKHTRASCRPHCARHCAATLTEA